MRVSKDHRVAGVENDGVSLAQFLVDVFKVFFCSKTLLHFERFSEKNPATKCQCSSESHCGAWANFTFL